MKWCSASFIVKKYQLKPHWDTISQPTGMAVSKRLTAPDIGKNVKPYERPYIVGGSVQEVGLPWITLWKFLVWLNLELPTAVDCTPSYWPTAVKTQVHKKICTEMFTAVLVIAPKTGKNQDILQQDNKKINWYSHMRKYLWAVRRPHFQHTPRWGCITAGSLTSGVDKARQKGHARNSVYKFKQVEEVRTGVASGRVGLAWNWKGNQRKCGRGWKGSTSY